ALLLRDWFFLLSSGTRVTALGSSDTHRLRDVKAGYPRSWLRLPSDDVTRLLDSDLANAIKWQRAIASNGPFALLHVDGAQIGDHQGGTVTPFVITNPVFLDGDGDGAWRPAISEPDPGPIGPITRPGPEPLDAPDWIDRAHPVPQDCEPPLWANPTLWGTP